MISVEKPKDIPEYVTWLAQARRADVSFRNETHFNTMLPKAQRDMQESVFWIDLVRRLPEYDQEYYVLTGYRLLAGPMWELQVKSYNSFLLKTFRKNVLENKEWPEPPQGGWYLPDNWFSRINDLIRTIVVVKYLDGVEFLATRLRALCEEHKLLCRLDFEARESGYYAAHLYVLYEFEVPQFDWNTQTLTMWTEIQLTTQLQETILKLTHRFYEERRELSKPPDGKWQWNYRSDEFAANYLGHILHYVEGMIMEIRDKQRGSRL